MQTDLDDRLKADSSKLDNRIAFWRTMAFTAFVCGLVFGYFGIDSVYPIDQTEIGNIGSFLQGAVSSCWSLAGIILIYVAFLGQKQQMILQQQEIRTNIEELKVNHKELEKTRSEIEGQRKQMEQQNLTLKHQRFESSFFQLLDFHNKIVSSMNPRTTDSMRVNGRNAFRELYDQLHNSYKGLSFQDEEVHIHKAYETFYDARQEFLGHYFRHLLNVVRYVDDSDLDKEGKRKYVRLVRAQLSTYEQLLLFYNCLCPQGEHFFDLVVKYGLVKEISVKNLLSPSHRKFYSGVIFDEDRRKESFEQMQIRKRLFPS